MMLRLRFLIFLLLLPPLLAAQTSAEPYEVAAITFEGNASLQADLLKSVLQTRETPGALWKFLFRISEKLGSSPETYDPLVFEGDYLRLQRFYQDQGFLQSQIDTTIRFDHAGRKVTLGYVIDEGRRSLIDSIHYVGTDGMPSILLEELHAFPVIRVGDPFVVERVEGELRRAIAAFVNNGFGGLQVQPVSVRRYASTNNVTVTFTFQPGDRFRVGEIFVVQDPVARDTVSPTIVYSRLDFESGDFYSEAKRQDSERNLNRLGLFETSRVEALQPVQSNGTVDVPMRVSVRARPFHDLTPEIGANDEDRTFNVLFGIGYNNRNFFGGARNFNTRTRFSLQSIQEVNFSRVFKETGLKDSSLVSKLELSSQIIQPYFFSNKVSLSTTIAYRIEKQKPYSANILLGRVGVAAQMARYTRSTADWNLERVEPEGADSILARRVDLKPQFNSILTLTMQRDKRNDLFSPSEGFFHSLTLEEAGILPAVFGGVFSSGLPFSRYYKVHAVGQWYWDPSKIREFIWAGRLSAGFAELYGGSTVPVPLTRRFYAGGSGSVRGWKSRELG
ncbi:MAG: BamA/TamA family outer membrane protein, partial [Bacteroidota bacterium]